MSTNFPTTLDSLLNPGADTAMDSAGYEHDVQHANINDAVEAIQTKVGVDGSAIATSLDYLIKAATDPGHLHSIYAASAHNHDDAYVALTGTQHVAGVKIFDDPAYFSVATGVMAFTVASETVITHLNADMLDGLHASSFTTLTSNQTISGIKTFSSVINSTVAQGTAPFVIASTTVVSKLNAQYLGGNESTFFATSAHTHYGVYATDIHVHTNLFEPLMIGSSSPASCALEVTGDMRVSGGYFDAIFRMTLSTVSTNTNNNKVAVNILPLDCADIIYGVTDSGTRIGINIVVVPGVNLKGTLSRVYGDQTGYGTYTGATGTIVTAVGKRLVPYNYGGTITNSYGVVIEAPIGTLGTIVNEWGFYQVSTTASNAFAGNVRIGSVIAPTCTLDVTGDLKVSGAYYDGVMRMSPITVAADSNNVSVALTVTGSDCALIATGVTDIGVRQAMTFSLTAGPGLVGTLSTMRGMNVNYGISTGATGTITSAMGIRLTAHRYAGTTTNSYGILLEATVGSAGTITNEWGILQRSLTANNAFGGNTRIGSVDAPTVALDVTGEVKISGKLGVATIENAGSIFISPTTGNVNLNYNTANSTAQFKLYNGGTTTIAMQVDSTGTGWLLGKLRVGSNVAPTYAVDVTGDLRVSGNIYDPIIQAVDANVATNTSNSRFALEVNVYPSISAGVTDSGARRGVSVMAYGSTNLIGTMNALYGMRIAYGTDANAPSTAVINTAYGLVISGGTAGAGKGAIGTLYGIYLSTAPTGVTTEWGLQQTSTTAINAFGGSLRIGSITAPTVALDVTGAVKTSAACTFGSASTDLITVTGRLLVRTAASDPQHATAASRPAGTVKEIVYYSGKLYMCTNATTPTWEKITSV